VRSDKGIEQNRGGSAVGKGRMEAALRMGESRLG